MTHTSGISKEMKFASEMEARKDGCYPIAGPMLQAGINAAWTKFDANDESTWPDDNPHKELLVMNVQGAISFSRFGTIYEGRRKVWSHGYFGVIKYADPDNFKPKEVL